MFAILNLYLLSILAGAFAAAALALLGCHLATRDKAMQTICISQGAMLGVLLGLGWFGHEETTNAAFHLHLGPNSIGVMISAGVFCLSELWQSTEISSPNAMFTSLFMVLLSLSYLVSSLFPSLESHLAQVYFGDLATLCNADAITTGVFSAACFILFVSRSRRISKQSFDCASIGKTCAHVKDRIL